MTTRAVSGRPYGERMQLQACLNGARDVATHPRLRPEPALLAREAASEVGAGAWAVHLHPKDAAGLEDSLSLPDSSIARDTAALLAAAAGRAATAAPDRPQ